MNSAARVRIGILYAILACAGWGFAFVGPLILSDWPGLAVAAGRYMAYGLGSIVTLWLLHRRGRVNLRDAALWREAAVLTLFGNLLYYALLSVSVQKAGYVMPTLIIGLLPVTVSLAARIRDRQPLTARYLWALLLILGGLWLAQAPTAAKGSTAFVDGPTRGELIGWACATGSLLLWTVYGVMNAERLKLAVARPGGMTGLQWTSLQGAAALPFSLLLFAATQPATIPVAQGWWLFGGISLFLGLVTSWAANTLWNMSSHSLPSSLLGQMIVFETIAGIAYGAVWSGAAPPLTVLIGTAILIAGVIVAVSERSRAAAPQAA